MKTQISRNSLQPEKRYSGVYQQQGRMITDADWNELSDLDKHKLWEALRDTIQSGAPRANGLQVNSDKSLQPGILYAEGVPARLLGNAPVAFTAQPDFPGASALPTNNFSLYADVWDRAVTSLEDSALVDPGLHGADTCSRTQTMLQVKWCPNTVDPQNAAQNPAWGNAELKLRLRTVFSGADPCDPCAAQVNVDAKVGNYLFRVEVHDRYQQGGNDFLVLKWSRDNGSEQYAVSSAPSDFQNGDWIYEFFNDVTEKNLGVHLATGFAPLRGVLVDGYVVPVDPSKPKTYARQWDGYAIVNLTSNTLVTGKDKGVALSTAYAADAQGQVTFPNTAGQVSFHVNLDLLVLDLNLSGRTLVAGDFWQGLVREATQSAGDYVLGTAAAGATPAGIRHHYVTLAGINGAGAVIAQTDAQKRQFHFPPLSDIHAADVGFTEHCHTLFNGAQNVQDALDALCALAANDIAYALPTCPVTPSVASLLASTPNWPDLDLDGKITVKDMLDALLCRLNAASLPYNGTLQSARWTSIKSEASPDVPPTTVQQALDDLVQYLDSKDIPHVMQNCPVDSEPTVRTGLGLTGPTYSVADVLTALLCQKQTSGSGCCVCIGPGGDFQTLQKALDAFAANPAQWTDLVLCLKPGNHLVPGNVEITGKRSVKITGAGTSASVIQFQGATFHIQAQEICFEDLGFVATQAGGQLNLEAPSVSAEDCLFRRAGNNPNAPSLIAVTAPTKGGDVFFQNNQVQSTWQQVKSGVKVGGLAPVTIVGAAMAANFNKLFTNATLADPVLFDSTLTDLANQIVALPQSARNAWSKAAPQNALTAAKAKVASKSAVKSTAKSTAKSKKAAPAPVKNASVVLPIINIPSFPVINIGLPVVASTQNFYSNLTQANLAISDVKANLAGLVAASIQSGFCQALTLSSVLVGGTLAYNKIAGEVVTLNNGVAGMDIGKSGVLQVIGSVQPVNPASGAKFDLLHNSITRLSLQIPAGNFDKDDNGRLMLPMASYSILNVTDNFFGNNENAFASGVLKLNGNSFAGNATTAVVTLLANQLTVVGNSVGSSSGGRYHAAVTAFAANLMALTVLT